MNSLSKAMQSKIRTHSRDRILRQMNSLPDGHIPQQPIFKQSRTIAGGKRLSASKKAMIESQQFELNQSMHPMLSYHGVNAPHHDLSEQEILMPNQSASLFDNNDYTNPFLNRSTHHPFTNSNVKRHNDLSPARGINNKHFNSNHHGLS